MQMSDTREIAAPTDIVWRAILDPEVLRLVPQLGALARLDLAQNRAGHLAVAAVHVHHPLRHLVGAGRVFSREQQTDRGR